jgi:dihydrodipicolinate synthase/N-acetylneuraminate lyase
MSAVLLPYTDDGDIDWTGFTAHLEATATAGLVPAVNMDTGYGPVLTDDERSRALAIAAELAQPFVAGAHVADDPGDGLDLDGYRREFDRIGKAGATPIVFPSFGLAALDDEGIVDAHRRLAANADAFLGFELGAMFHPAGRIFPVDVFEALLAIPQLVGAKHSSLERRLEWERLALRDEHRPDFLLLTGNDLAIDMVIYGSDYLLGLSTFAPEAFAARDRAWVEGDDARFWALNDTLQYLGHFAFRDPVPGYRHDAAMFLAQRGRIAGSGIHPSSPRRPESDRDVLAAIAHRLDELEVPGETSV